MSGSLEIPELKEPTGHGEVQDEGLEVKSPPAVPKQVYSFTFYLEEQSTGEDDTITPHENREVKESEAFAAGAIIPYSGYGDEWSSFLLVKVDGKNLPHKGGSEPKAPTSHEHPQGGEEEENKGWIPVPEFFLKFVSQADIWEHVPEEQKKGYVFNYFHGEDIGGEIFWCHSNDILRGLFFMEKWRATVAGDSEERFKETFNHNIKWCRKNGEEVEDPYSLIKSELEGGSTPQDKKEEAPTPGLEEPDEASHLEEFSDDEMPPLVEVPKETSQDAEEPKTTEGEKKETAREVFDRLVAEMSTLSPQFPSPTPPRHASPTEQDHPHPPSPQQMGKEESETAKKEKEEAQAQKIMEEVD